MAESSLRRSLRRIFAMASKETRHIRRDARTLYFALGIPVVQLMLFGFGVSFDVDHVPLAIVDQDHSAASIEVRQAFFASEDFELVGESDNVADAESFLRDGEASGVLVIPKGLESKLARHEPVELQMLIDGSDGNATNQVLNKSAAIGRTLGVTTSAVPTRPSIEVRTWTRYNPSGKSAMYLVPGLMGMVLAMSAVLLTSLSIAREWERGSMEQLFATPVGRFEIVAGKLTTYFGLGSMQALLALTAGVVVFGVPIRGSLFLVALGCGLFMTGMLGLGLMISVTTKNQLVATQMSMQASMMPSMLLSGFIFPVQNMPWVLQILATIVPARWFVSMMRAVLLKGAGFSTVWTELLGLAIFAVVMIVLSTRRFKRKLA